MDKAGREYWESCWTDAPLPHKVEPRAKGWKNRYVTGMHGLLSETFGNRRHPGLRLLEVGCGGSPWLPYFRTEYGFEIFGIDYTESGCLIAKRHLNACGVEGVISCADMFSPPVEMTNAFDVVVSFGVVEHFENTARCLKAIARFLKPGGIIVTAIPNLAGIYGTIQKTVDKSVFDLHVPLSREDLAEAHRAAGFHVDRADYLLGVDLWVLNFEHIEHRGIRFVARSMRAVLGRILGIADYYLRLPGSRFLSPYVTCIAGLHDDFEPEWLVAKSDADAFVATTSHIGAK